MIFLFRSVGVAILVFFTEIIHASEIPFRDQIPPYSLTNELLILSHTIYDIDSLDSEAIPSFLTPVKYITNRFDSEVLIAVNNKAKYIVVGFQGTRSLKDVLVNFYQVAFTFYGPNESEIQEAGRVHNGQNNVLFNYGLYDAIEKDILALWTDHPGYKIHFTGHSQGGALALLSAPIFALYHPSASVTMISFGQPRCVKQEFKDWSRSIDNLSLWNVVLRDDPVPRAPKSVRGYRHAGHLIQLENEGAKLYYQFTGAEGYIGFPEDWEYKLGKLHEDHESSNYFDFFVEKSAENKNKYYAVDFERDFDNGRRLSSPFREKKIMISQKAPERRGSVISLLKHRMHSIFHYISVLVP